MLFTIEHTTEYRFNRPVFFEPHQLRLQPRTDGAQRLVRFDLQIEPTPVGLTHAFDTEGNVVALAWFNDLHDRMVLRAISEVETLRENAYDFLLTPANRRLPIGYQPWELVQLTAALKRAAVPIHVDPARSRPASWPSKYASAREAKRYRSWRDSSKRSASGSR
jgi:transglutaminase-like putative cysteine protease